MTETRLLLDGLMLDVIARQLDFSREDCRNSRENQQCKKALSITDTVNERMIVFYVNNVPRQPLYWWVSDTFDIFIYSKISKLQRLNLISVN